jgi:hypothetical protein
VSSHGITGFFALAMTALAASPLTAAELRCPPRLPGTHAGFEQVGPVPAAHWLLRRMRLFNVPLDATSKTPPAELLPDRTVEHGDVAISTWRFAGNENLLMVCSYNGSGTYYVSRVRPPPTSCAMLDTDGLRRAWCEIP